MQRISIERKRKKGKDPKEVSSKKKISLDVFDFTSDEEEINERTEQSDASRVRIIKMIPKNAVVVMVMSCCFFTFTPFSV